MSYWLSLVLREEREQRRVSRLRIASHLGVDPSTIVRLEKGGNTYSDDLDRYAAAYAEILGINDGRLLWRQALDRWMLEGMPPVQADSPAERVTRIVEETARQAQAQRQARGQESPQPPQSTPSKPRKRAAG